MIVVDTSVWVDHLGTATNAHTEWLDRALGSQRIALTDLILCEVLQGVRGDATYRALRDDLLKFVVIDTGGSALAVAAADSYRLLRKRGHTVRKTIDCLIATVCIQEGHSLLHRDRDFDPFEDHLGLHVIHPERLL